MSQLIAGSGLTSGIVVAVVLTTLPLVFRAFERTAIEQAQSAALEGLGDLDLRQYQWLSWVYAVCFLAAASGSAYAVAFHPKAWEAFTFVGVLFALIGFWGVCDALRSRITVRGSRVVYRRLFSETSFELVEVKSVRTFRGNIIVDLGRVPRIAIPTIFRNSGKLLALLTYHRPKSA